MNTAERAALKGCEIQMAFRNKAKELVRKFMNEVHEDGKLSYLNHVVIKAINPGYQVHEKVEALCGKFGLLAENGDLKPQVRDILLEKYKPEARTPSP